MEPKLPPQETPEEAKRRYAENQKKFDETVRLFRLDLIKAVIRVENIFRKDRNAPLVREDATVYLPTTLRANMQLLNLRVWTIRYHVSLDYILLKAFNYFKKIRKVFRSTTEISLGISPTALCSTRFREVLEQEVLADFPNGENRAINPQPIVTIKFGDYNTPEQFVKQYEANIEKARKRFDNMMKVRERIPKRNYRKV